MTRLDLARATAVVDAAAQPVFRGRVEEVWVKDWLHVERVASHHARVRIGTTHFDVRVEGDAMRLELQRAPP